VGHLEQFVQWLVDQQGLPADVDPEVRKQFEADLLRDVTNYLNQRLLEALDPVALERLSNLVDSDPEPDAITRFIERNVPDRDQVTRQALAEFGKNYLGR
jgi:hypothetical protein